MTLIDSSAWVEFLRATGSAANRSVRRLMSADDERIVTTEVVHLELLAGARTDAEVTHIRRLLARYELVPVEGLIDFNEAALIYRTCRRHGETVHARFDCLIAAVAIRVDAEVLHSDRDFEVMARHTPLRLAS